MVFCEDKLSDQLVCSKIQNYFSSLAINTLDSIYEFVHVLEVYAFRYRKTRKGFFQRGLRSGCTPSASVEAILRAQSVHLSITILSILSKYQDKNAKSRTINRCIDTLVV